MNKVNCCSTSDSIELSLSRRSSLLSYRNQSTDLRSKSMNWSLYDRNLRYEQIKVFHNNLCEAL